MLLREVNNMEETLTDMSESVNKLNTTLAVVINTQHYQGETLKVHESRINAVSQELNKLGGN